ncbi:putative protein of unknown function (DUF4539) [Monocercomonoides exilis]|uniref:putative protein of unknown function (DUF4539) n=1 Tax=Monocercomonoides exilis TaxID=2049356 RepID=UPI00355AC5DB|nr:putative protein of unknown function (DUF4539) [Monocercomonoides exilis]|eukprot:MONOS_5537.1-p1 / transcript=MONOS_5537.1 / gene=MONOS_5537 / organism=Monocercomonoides_exilis_PA203 / gene_product=unspecified product / transcript_product=unspecified product / location=Mono_scaffold00162:64893-67444(+) / protein_length=829 / sequence_SO=supercontig / SO=protein_coding / is_pseudo=false
MFDRWSQQQGPSIFLPSQGTVEPRRRIPGPAGMILTEELEQPQQDEVEEQEGSLVFCSLLSKRYKSKQLTIKRDLAVPERRRVLQGPWKRMSDAYKATEDVVVAGMFGQNVKHILDEMPADKPIPHLAAMIKSFERSELFIPGVTNRLALFSDATGEILGTVQYSVITEHFPNFVPNAVVVLRDVPIFHRTRFGKQLLIGTSCIEAIFPPWTEDQARLEDPEKQQESSTSAQQRQEQEQAIEDQEYDEREFGNLNQSHSFPEEQSVSNQREKEKQVVHGNTPEDIDILDDLDEERREGDEEHARQAQIITSAISSASESLFDTKVTPNEHQSPLTLSERQGQGINQRKNEDSDDSQNENEKEQKKNPAIERKSDNQPQKEISTYENVADKNKKLKLMFQQFKANDKALKADLSNLSKKRRLVSLDGTDNERENGEEINKQTNKSNLDEDTTMQKDENDDEDEDEEAFSHLIPRSPLMRTSQTISTTQSDQNSSSSSSSSLSNSKSVVDDFSSLQTSSPSSTNSIFSSNVPTPPSGYFASVGDTSSSALSSSLTPNIPYSSVGSSPPMLQQPVSSSPLRSSSNTEPLNILESFRFNSKHPAPNKIQNTSPPSFHLIMKNPLQNPTSPQLDSLHTPSSSSPLPLTSSLLLSSTPSPSPSNAPSHLPSLISTPPFQSTTTSNPDPLELADSSPLDKLERFRMNADKSNKSPQHFSPPVNRNAPFPATLPPYNSNVITTHVYKPNMSVKREDSAVDSSNSFLESFAYSSSTSSERLFSNENKNFQGATNSFSQDSSSQQLSSQFYSLPQLTPPGKQKSELQDMDLLDDEDDEM